MTYRQRLAEHIRRKYGASPERLWMRYPDYAVFRHADNGKWFALVMDVSREKLHAEGKGTVDVLNVRMTDPVSADLLTGKPGYFRGYHSARGNWVTVLLDGTVPFGEITERLAESYLSTASKETRRSLLPPKDWLIPANPAYYDVVGAFGREGEIRWKQGKGIRKGDTVYMYVGAPVSAILFRCLVTETDIPYAYGSRDLTIKSLMRIRLERTYPADRFTFAALSGRYGVRAVRGPRGVPDLLLADLRGERL